MMSVAAGMAANGTQAFVATFASFASLLCAEHLRTDLAYTQVPVRVLAHHAGIAMGFYGTSHHAVEDIAITRSMAGMVVMAPCDAMTTRACLRATLDEPGPVYLRLGRGNEHDVHDYVPALERGRFLQVREGRDATVIAGQTAHLDRLAMEDEYALVAPPTHLYRHYGFTADGVETRLRRLLEQ